MIYVTHDQTEAMTLADNIIVMRDGRIEQAGTPEELYQNPNNLFVAGFIGSPRMNFLRGKAASGTVVLDAGASVRGPGSGDVRLGIRPEHLQVGSEGASLSATVDVVENLGGTRYLYATTRSGENLVVEAREQTGVKAGDTVALAFRQDRAMLFSPVGERLHAA
jgi:lactose/L-arabinose transport system ATP-binding protein